MGRLDTFYSKCCEKYTENDVLLKTEFEKITINTADEEYKDNRVVSINNVVRFFNPKVHFKTIRESVIEVNDLPPIDDFDAALDFLEEEAEEMYTAEDFIYYEDKKVCFLPHHIEKKLKDITCGPKRNKIDRRLKPLISKEDIEEFDLSFNKETDEEVMVEYHLRGSHALSLFKFYNVETLQECGKAETELRINKLKYDLNTDTVMDSFERYFIGDVDFEAGLFEKDTKEHKENQNFYHFNFWKLHNVDLEKVTDGFGLYPFSREVLSNEY